MLCLYFSPVGEFEPGVVFNQLVQSLADIYLAFLTIAFHSGGYIDGVAPNIVLKLFDTHNSGYDRSGMNTAAYLEKMLALRLPRVRACLNF